MTTQHDPATVAAAKQAVQTMWQFRFEMADTLSLEDWIYDVKEVSREAKLAGKRISDDDWIRLAEGVDDICDDDCLPRLFRIED